MDALRGGRREQAIRGITIDLDNRGNTPNHVARCQKQKQHIRLVTQSARTEAGSEHLASFRPGQQQTLGIALTLYPRLFLQMRT